MYAYISAIRYSSGACMFYLSNRFMGLIGKISTYVKHICSTCVFLMFNTCLIHMLNMCEKYICRTCV